MDKRTFCESVGLFETWCELRFARFLIRQYTLWVKMTFQHFLFITSQFSSWLSRLQNSNNLTISTFSDYLVRVVKSDLTENLNLLFYKAVLLTFYLYQRCRSSKKASCLHNAFPLETQCLNLWPLSWKCSLCQYNDDIRATFHVLFSSFICLMLSM